MSPPRFRGVSLRGTCKARSRLCRDVGLPDPWRINDSLTEYYGSNVFATLAISHAPTCSVGYRSVVELHNSQCPATGHARECRRRSLGGNCAPMPATRVKSSVALRSVPNRDGLGPLASEPRPRWIPASMSRLCRGLLRNILSMGRAVLGVPADTPSIAREVGVVQLSLNGAVDSPPPVSNRALRPLISSPRARMIFLTSASV